MTLLFFILTIQGRVALVLFLWFFFRTVDSLHSIWKAHQQKLPFLVSGPPIVAFFGHGFLFLFSVFKVFAPPAWSSDRCPDFPAEYQSDFVFF